MLRAARCHPVRRGDDRRPLLALDQRVICVAPGIWVIGRAIRVRRERLAWSRDRRGPDALGDRNVYYLFFLTTRSDPVACRRDVDRLLPAQLHGPGAADALPDQRVPYERLARRHDRRDRDRRYRGRARLRHRARRRRGLEVGGGDEPDLPAGGRRPDRAGRGRARRQRLVRGSGLGDDRDRVRGLRRLGQLLPVPVGRRLVRARALGRHRLAARDAARRLRGLHARSRRRVEGGARRRHLPRPPRPVRARSLRAARLRPLRPTEYHRARTRLPLRARRRRPDGSRIRREPADADHEPPRGRSPTSSPACRTGAG